MVSTVVQALLPGCIFSASLMVTYFMVGAFAGVLSLVDQKIIIMQEIFLFFAADLENTPTFVEQHSGALTILVLSFLILGTLLILVPQLLRSHQRTLEMMHEQHMKALEQGLPVSPTDDRSRSAGRIAMLVPMVVIISAATVTCFLVAYQASDHMFAMTLAVWCVAGVVSLAAITGGVALMGRLAQLGSTEEQPEDEEVPSNPLKG